LISYTFKTAYSSL